MWEIPPPIPLQCVLLANRMRRSLTKVSNRAHPPSSAAFSKLFYCSLNDSFPYHTFQHIRGGNHIVCCYEISRVRAKLGVIVPGKTGIIMLSLFNILATTRALFRRLTLSLCLSSYCLCPAVRNHTWIENIVEILKIIGIFLCLKSISVNIFAFVQRCATT